MADSTKVEVLAQKQVPIEYYGYYDLAAIYADQVVVSNTENEFTLYFFHAETPFFLQPEDLDRMDKIRAKCVARVVIPPKLMEKAVGALQINLEKFKAAHGQRDQATAEVAQ